MLKKDDGFTLVELIMVVWVIIWISFVITAVITLSTGNFWYSEGSVLRELKAEHPQVTEIVKAKRNIWRKSVITVKEGGINHDYRLDTNVLWNYTFSE